MRHVQLRRASVASLALMLAVSLGCSSGGDDNIPAGTCQHASVPSTGPGDTANYFPAEVGWTWTYRNETSNVFGTTTVTGTQPVGTETAWVFQTTTTSDPTPTTELVVKRPAGVYVLSDPSAEPPFNQLYPSLVLPFPVAVTASAEQARCHALNLGDLDGDGRDDHADITVSLQVLSVNETATVGAGSFVDVAHVQTLAHITATGSAVGTVVVDATQDDWFAKDVGRVLSLLTFETMGLSESTTVSLQSYSAPGAALVVAPLVSRATAPARAPRLGEAALLLAREALAARR